jgi:ABC-2 type transport system permease protein
VAGVVLAASYFVTSMASLNESLAALAQFLPYDYFQGGDALQGLNLTWFFGLLAATAVLFALAWWRFLRRDIRVAGEGGWRLPSIPLRLRRGAQAEQSV